MIFVYSIISLALIVLLVGVKAITFRAPSLSRYELERRHKTGNTSATDELRRVAVAKDIVALQRLVEVMIIVLLSCMLVAQWSFLGCLAALVVVVLYQRVARIKFIRNTAQRIFNTHETSLVQFIEKYSHVATIVSSPANDAVPASVGSREELDHLIHESVGILSTDEKKLLRSSLHFASKTVEYAMTPRNVLEVIDSGEVLGPIVLDQLHKTGHSRFPVTDGDIDHIVGVLHIHELLSLREKTSQTAQQSMEKKVFYINQSQTLSHALAAFLSTRHHLFIVVNAYRETVGILTLEDCIEALIGRKIVDEYDAHDDLRIVAERRAAQTNNASGSTNV